MLDFNTEIFLLLSRRIRYDLFHSLEFCCTMIKTNIFSPALLRIAFLAKSVCFVPSSIALSLYLCVKPPNLHADNLSPAVVRGN